jgi:hypothetical protein
MIAESRALCKGAMGKRLRLEMEALDKRKDLGYF